VQWFRNHFNDCFEKAEWAKSKCGEDMPESAAYVEKLIYDKAIELVGCGRAVTCFPDR
jgi:serine/threonine-protein kinase ULK/ATG1